jgi:hypothetical protein
MKRPDRRRRWGGDPLSGSRAKVKWLTQNLCGLQPFRNDHCEAEE